MVPSYDDHLLNLVRQAIDPRTSDDELNLILEELNRAPPHPAISDLLFHHEPELSPEEILKVAQAYATIKAER